MEYKNLGRSGLKVSVVGLGCMNFGMMNDEAQSADIVDKGHRSRRQPVRHGRRVRRARQVGGISRPGPRQAPPGSDYRDEVCRPDVNERFDMQGGSRRYIMQAVEASLTRLGTDYIDLYQMHRFDDDTPLEETLRALDDLVRQGKVRYVGSSNYAAWQITDADWTARSANLNGFVSIQNRYSLLTRDIEKEVVPACENSGSASCRTSRSRAAF